MVLYMAFFHVGFFPYGQFSIWTFFHVGFFPVNICDHGVLSVGFSPVDFSPVTTRNCTEK